MAGNRFEPPGYRNGNFLLLMEAKELHAFFVANADSRNFAQGAVKADRTHGYKSAGAGIVKKKSRSTGFFCKFVFIRSMKRGSSGSIGCGNQHNFPLYSFFREITLLSVAAVYPLAGNPS